MADVTIVDYTTDPPTITERDFTPAELEQREADIAAVEAELVAEEEALAAREAAKASALEKLQALGLTVEEVSAIL